MATKKTTSTQPLHSSTSEPAAKIGGSVTIDGEPIGFALPDWALTDMQLPLDVPAQPPRKPAAYRDVWAKLWSSSAELQIQGVSDEALAAARGRSRIDAPTSLDVDLEAHTLLLANTLVYGEHAAALAPNALSHWTSISDPVTAARVALRARELGGWLPSEMLDALRDHQRIYGESVRAVLSEAPLDDSARAHLLDDEAAALRLHAKGNVMQLATLVGLFSDPAITRSVIAAIARENPAVLRVPAVLRAVRRHGLDVADAALAQVEAAFADPAVRDTERAPWIAVLACYPSKRAARIALAMSGSKASRSALLSTFGGMREQASAVLAEAAKGKGKAAKSAAELLAALDAA